MESQRPGKRASWEGEEQKDFTWKGCLLYLRAFIGLGTVIAVIAFFIAIWVVWG